MHALEAGQCTLLVSPVFGSHLAAMSSRPVRPVRSRALAAKASKRAARQLVSGALPDEGAFEALGWSNVDDSVVQLFDAAEKAEAAERAAGLRRKPRSVTTVSVGWSTVTPDSAALLHGASEGGFFSLEVRRRVRPHAPARSRSAGLARSWHLSSSLTPAAWASRLAHGRRRSPRLRKRRHRRAPPKSRARLTGRQPPSRCAQPPPPPPSPPPSRPPRLQYRRRRRRSCQRHAADACCARSRALLVTLRPSRPLLPPSAAPLSRRQRPPPASRSRPASASASVSRQRLRRLPLPPPRRRPPCRCPPSRLAGRA